MKFHFSHSQDDPDSLIEKAEQDFLNAAVQELSPTTSYYGIGDIFRKYAGLPDDEPLPFGADHYIPWEEENPHHGDLPAGFPAFLATTKHRARAYSENGIPRAIAAGSAFHYLHAFLESRDGPSSEAKSERRGTIAFPHKSTVGIDRTFDYAAFADKLVNLPREYHPIAVCIYWQDYQSGRHQAYLDAGLQVISCGTVYDPLFLHRFIDAVSRFRFACGNAIGSSYPLAVSCGCPFFLLESGPIRETRTDKSTGRVMENSNESSSGTLQELRRLAQFPLDLDNFQLQQEYVKKLMGKRFLKSPKQIHRIYTRSRKMLLKNQGNGENFTKLVPLQALNRWLPRGIYPDGWARQSCQLTVRSQGTLVLCLLIPPEITPDERPFRVTIGETEPLEFSLRPGYYQLWLPGIPTEGTIIRFRTPIEKQMLPEDTRHVAFRFLVWKHDQQSPLPEPGLESIGWRKVELLMKALEEEL